MRSKVKYFILIILIIVSAIRITVLNINAKDYKLKIENYKVGDTFVIKGYEYIIDGYSIVDADEMERLCGYRDERIDGKYAIVDMRYYKGYTQAKTASVLGISQVQVSRKEKALLSKLRRYIE